jgi:hypothetical protein
MEPSARAELFSETAARLGVADAIVEKDFWVCWVLKQLFSDDVWHPEESYDQTTDKEG